MCYMITEASEDGEGYLPLCTELSLTHSFSVDSLSCECQCDFACLVCSAELSKVLARGSKSSVEKLFSTTPSLPIWSCRILIAFSLSEDLLLRRWGAERALLTYIACFWVCVRSLMRAFVARYCCCYSFCCLESAGSAPDGFSFSWRLTFMLPAQADTLRACALSRFTDVKQGSNCYYKTGNTNTFWCFLFFFPILMYTFGKHEIYRIDFS